MVGSAFWWERNSSSWLLWSTIHRPSQSKPLAMVVRCLQSEIALFLSFTCPWIHQYFSLVPQKHQQPGSCSRMTGRHHRNSTTLAGSCLAPKLGTGLSLLVLSGLYPPGHATSLLQSPGCALQQEQQWLWLVWEFLATETKLSFVWCWTNAAKTWKRWCLQQKKGCTEACWSLDLATSSLSMVPPRGKRP